MSLNFPLPRIRGFLFCATLFNCIFGLITAFLYISFGVTSVLIGFNQIPTNEFSPPMAYGYVLFFMVYEREFDLSALPGMNKASRLVIESTPIPAIINMFWAVVNIVMGNIILWCSIQLTRMIKRRELDENMIARVVAVIFIAFIADIGAAVACIAQLTSTKTLRGIAETINGRLVSVFDNPDTSIVAPLMAAFSMKFGVSLLILVILVSISFFIRRSILRLEEYRASLNFAQVRAIRARHIPASSLPKRFRNRKWTKMPRFDSLKDSEWYERRLANRAAIEAHFEMRPLTLADEIAEMEINNYGPDVSSTVDDYLSDTESPHDITPPIELTPEHKPTTSAQSGPMEHSKEPSLDDSFKDAEDDTAPITVVHMHKPSFSSTAANYGSDEEMSFGSDDGTDYYTPTLSSDPALKLSFSSTNTAFCSDMASSLKEDSVQEFNEQYFNIESPKSSPLKPIIPAKETMV